MKSTDTAVTKTDLLEHALSWELAKKRRRLFRPVRGTSLRRLRDEIKRKERHLEH